MKRTIAFFLALVVAFALVACGKEEKNTAENSSTDSPAETNAGVQVDEGLLNVDITMPASFFSDTTEEEIKAAAIENGYQCVINEDGSVTYTMSKAKHKETLQNFKTSIDETIEGFVNGENAVEAFQRIEYNENVSKVDIYVDKDKYTSFDALYGLSFYIMGAYYQMFSGDAPDAIDVVVNFIDVTTNETIHTMSYRDYLQSNDTTAQTPSNG